MAGSAATFRICFLSSKGNMFIVNIQIIQRYMKKKIISFPFATSYLPDKTNINIW